MNDVSSHLFSFQRQTKISPQRAQPNTSRETSLNSRHLIAVASNTHPRAGFSSIHLRGEITSAYRSCNHRGKRAKSSPLREAFYSSPASSTARNAFCGISTLPTIFIRFLPSFCFSSSLRLRVMSPP